MVFKIKNMKTVKVGDWIRFGKDTGILCQVGPYDVSLIIMRPGPPNRWSNKKVVVHNRAEITYEELSNILNDTASLDQYEIKVGKRYVNLEKYFKIKIDIF